MENLNTPANEKTKYSFYQNIKYLLKMMFDVNSDSKFKLIMTYVYGIVPEVFTPLAATFILKIIIDCITGDADAKTLLISFFAFAAVNIVFQAMTYKNAMELTAYSEKWRYIILGNIIRKNLSVSYEDIESYEKRKIFDKAVSSVFYGDLGLSQFLFNIQKMIIALTGIAAFFALVALADPWILAVCIFSAAVNFIFCVLSKKVSIEENREYLGKTRKARYLSTGKGSDLKAAKDMKIFNVANWFTPLIDMLIGDYKRFENSANKKHFLYNTLTYGVFFVRDLSVFAILISLYSKGRLTAGDFAFYYSVISGANSWIFQVAQTYGELYSNHLYADDYRKCIEKEEDFSNAKPLEKFPEECTVEFDDVSFSYDGVHDAVSHLSFKIRAGEKIAIVGANGAGKTTTVKLLCGLYSPIGGRILINGKNIQEIAKEDRYRLFSAVFQDIFTMPSSIESNITMTEGKADEDLLQKSIKFAGLEEKIASLPDGVKTKLHKEINKNGIDLSGGETQKLLCARAIYKQSPIIILDEPTAALDPIAENELYMKYDEITKGKTSFYISHRLASTAFCDRILFMKDGSIVQEGPHEQLMKDKGEYFKMYSMQSYYYNEEPAGGENLE